MRWWRSCKRLMLLLMFVCMTVKLHLELRLLNATRSDNSFSPWWINETLGHIRGFPKNKLVTRGNDPLKAASKSVPPLGNSSLPGNALRSDTQTVISIGNKNSSEQGVKASPGQPIGAQSDSEVRKTKDTEVVASPPKPSNPKQKSERWRVGPLVISQNYTNRKLANEKPDNKVIKHSVVGNITHAGHSAKKGIVVKPKPNNEVVEETQSKKQEISIERLRVPPKVLAKNSQAARSVHKINSIKRGVSHDVDPAEVSLTEAQIENIKFALEVANDEQTIYNEERYGPVLRNTTILLVQVHNRLVNLRYLVESMKNTRGINESLVIFSHDYWYPAMNDFVTNITEFRVMQIFFPYSIQLHPRKFPGRDPRDCSWNVNKRAGINCLNQEWPDTYGHYREASFTQIKHHWWWKIHRVFNNLLVTKHNYTGHVVFLEEDHYILPDLLFVLESLRTGGRSHCPSCQVLALGNYNKMSPNVYKNFVERGDWWVTKHNLGFAIDGGAWKRISTCGQQFCQFDDYNWDWTMNNMVQTCFKPRMSMLSVKLSRVIHVGSCGTHVKKKNCDVSREVQVGKNRIATGKQWLFPKTLSYQNVYRGSGRVKKGNGGWGDLRDKKLCLAIWNGTASEKMLETLDMNQGSPAAVKLLKGN